MRLDSVRELKLSLPEHLERTFAVAPRRAMAIASSSRSESPADAIAAARSQKRASYFLGVAQKRGQQYQLAVRLQDRALERSALLDEIVAKARGEVDVRYVGTIRARAKRSAKGRVREPWYRSRQRPLLIGCSVGSLGDEYITAGTLACFVRKTPSGKLYVLSNNHVLADENRYKKGGPIVQPGDLDGGKLSRDRIGQLAEFIKLDMTGPNLVDCAIAKLDEGIEVDLMELKGLGSLAGIGPDLKIKEVVHKIGRTTGLRHGRVTAIELDDVTVEYDIGVLSFDNQIEIEGGGARAFSNAGDSGSLIVDDEMQARALLFAGGDHGGTNGKGLTYANPFKTVLSELKLQLA